MVQQQPMANGTVMQPALELENSSLAMPAVADNQPAQYSPQTALYQQQLIKGAKQFVSQQQQAANGRLNGLNGTNGVLHHSPQQQQQQLFGSQQNSPQQQQQLSLQFNQVHLNEALYTNSQQPAARPAPIYQPKPAFYAHIAPQQAQQQQQASQMYQTARVQPQQQLAMGAPHYQAQHSPSNLVLGPRQQQQTLAGLHVQQLASEGQQAVNMSSLQQQQLEQQQRQMQQLVISYQQQQQQQEQLQVQQQQHQSAYLSSRTQAQLQPHLNQLTAAPSWTPNAIQKENSSHLQQHQLNSQVELMRQQQQQHQRQASRLYLGPASGAASRFSDRDSVSTLSRFNQLDERRSFTMRSQYTQQAARRKGAKQFSFLHLTGEALRSLLGVGSSGLRGQSQPLLAAQPNAMATDGQTDQLGRNLSLAASGQSTKGPQLGQVTVIDSGEQLHFKRQVVRYQLAISRLLHVLLSVFVLLSPVVMLLLPKMEPFLNSQHELVEYSDAHSEAGLSSVSNVVTHAVGLVGKQVGGGVGKQVQQQQQQQQQWRISECPSSDCDGPLIGFVARLTLLALAHWALFFRAQTATLPRLDVQRCILVSLALLLTLAYWLFFLFRVFDKRHQDFELHYLTIVQFATSMLETLLVLHYVALVLLEMRHRKKSFCLKVVRSPDGASKFYSCGSLSIQKCAQVVLEKYHRDFGAFDARAEQLLELEDELAQELDRQRKQRHHNQQDSSSSVQARARSSSRRSRAGSPRRRDNSDRELNDDEDEANDERTETNDGDESAGARRTSGHHHHHHHHRRRRRHERNRRESEDEHEDDEREEAHKYRHKSPSKKTSPPSTSNKQPDEPKERDKSGSGHEQSSDGETSRLKESSLETIRAANVSSAEQQPRDIEVSERLRSPRAARSLEARDELESVRSGRSRRSTSSRMNRSRAGAAERDRKRARDHRERSASRSRSHAGDSAPAQISTHQPLESGSDRRDSFDEHERKLRRRSLRLLAAVAQSFERVRRLEEEAAKQQKGEQVDGAAAINMRPGSTPGALDASQAARALYPQIGRSLQKYLRLTKQTGRHNLQSIHEHLSKCLLYKLSARAFLEKFTNFGQVWQQNETNLFANCRLASPKGALAPLSGRELDQLELNSWSLVCDTLLSRQIEPGTFFLLKQGQVSLLVTVGKLPHLNLSEQVSEQNNCAFSLAPSPETSFV